MTEEFISLTPDSDTPQPTNVSIGVARERAKKINFAMGDNSHGVDYYTQSIIGGTEQREREQAALQKQLSDENQKMDIVRELAAQGPLDDTSYNTLLGLTSPELGRLKGDPNSFFEKEFAKKVISNTANLEDDSILSAALAHDAEGTHKVIDFFEDTIAFKEAVQKKLEEKEADWEKTSFKGAAYEYLEAFIPFVSWYQLQNATGREYTSSFLSGNNIAEQIQSAMLLPLDKRIEVVTKAIDEVYSRNKVNGLFYAQAFAAFTTSEQVLNNAISIGDLSLPLPLGKLASALKSTTVSVGSRTASVFRTTAATGDTHKAALIRAVEKLRTEAQTTNTAENFKQIEDAIPSLFNPTAVETTGTALSREALDRLQSSLGQSGSKLLKAVSDVIKLQRVEDPDVLNEAVKQTEKEFRAQYPHLSDAVLDAREVTGLGNTQEVAFTVGRNGRILERPGSKLQDIRPHLAERGVTVEEYIKHFGLPEDTPVAVKDGVFASVKDEEPPKYSLPSRQLDELGYYSGALEAAKSLKQAKGTPEQMLSQLKNAGARDAEIEATGLKSILNGKSVTKEQIVKHLEENRVEVRERVNQKISREELIARVRTEHPNWDSYEPARQRAIRYASSELEGPRWSRSSLDPDNPTYRETVLSLPASKREIELQRLLDENAAKQHGFSRPPQQTYERDGRSVEIYGADALDDVPKELLAENRRLTGELINLERDKFRTGHFPEPNIVGHYQSSIVTVKGDKKALNLDQFQSDWGQRLRDGGVRDEARIKELKNEGLDLEAKAKEQLTPDQFSAVFRGEGPEAINGERIYAGLDDSAKQTVDRYNLVIAELTTAEASISGNPLVNTTDQWVNTVLRHAVRTAVKEDLDYISIPHGDTVLSYNPEGFKGPAGMRKFYGTSTTRGVVEKNLQNILKSLDKETPNFEHVKNVKTPNGEKNRGSLQISDGGSDFGFSLFKITDKVRDAVLEGQPLFAKGRDVPAIKEASREAVEQVLNRLLPKTISREVVPTLHGTHGLYWRQTVFVALDVGNPIKTARHETIHALRTSKIITDREWNILLNYAKKTNSRKAYRIDDDYGAEYRANFGRRAEEALDEEAVAHMVADYLTGARFSKGADKLLEKIVKVLQNIKKALGLRGIRTAQDIMEDIESGAIAQRGRPAVKVNGKVFVGKDHNDAIRIALGKEVTDIDSAGTFLGNKDNLAYGSVDSQGNFIDSAGAASPAPSVSVSLGRTDASLFDTADEANNMAKDFYGLTNYTVQQKGEKFFIEVIKPINETGESVRNQLQIATANKTPASFANTFLNRLRTQDDMLSEDVVDDRKLITYAASAMETILQRAALPISPLNKTQRRSFKAFIERQRVHRDGLTGRIGKFNDTVGQFEAEWRNQFGMLPSEKEVTAYFTYKQISDLDWMVNNLGMYRDKVRTGTQHLSFKYTTDIGDFKTNPIEGRIITELPKIEDDAGVLVWDNGPTAYHRLKFHRKKIDELLESKEYRIIQTERFGEDSLRGSPGLDKQLANGRINYILAKDFTTSPLPFKQIPYSPGGHLEYTAGWYIKQPHIVSETAGGVPKSTYYNDRTLVNVQTEAQARSFEKYFNLAREAHRKGDKAERNRILAAHLPFSPQRFAQFFEPELGGFDVNVPFFVTPKGQRVGVTHNLTSQLDDKGNIRFPNFEDANNNPHNYYNGQLNLQFAMEKNEPINSVINVGSEQKPVFNLRPAEMVDAFETLDKSASTLLRNQYLRDMQIKTAERFIAEFADMLDAPIEKLRADPIKYLDAPPFKQGIEDTEKLASANNFRRAALELLGMKTDTQRIWANQRQKMANMVYKTGGQKAVDLIEPWLLQRKEVSPTRFIKQVAFHAKIGLFNPVQLFKQTQTLFHLSGIEGPQRAGHAIGLSTLMRYLNMTDSEEIIAHFSNKAGDYGINAANFRESYDGLRRTGLMNVGRELAVLDDYVEGSAVKTRLGSFLDFSSLFFNEGERFTRIAGWNAAYLRWRGANPKAVFNDKAIKEVLARANLLTANMARDSNAAWQKGILSIPTQFWAYPVRVAEQFLGKRLTPREKAQLFLTYSTVYGLPIGIGAAVGVWPVHESTREYLLEKGIDTDANVVSKVINDGVMSVILENTTGTKFNVGEAYGPGGISFIKDILEGDKDVIELFQGASGTTLADAFQASSPFLWSLTSLFDDEDNYYPITATDFHDFFRSVSSYNQFAKAWTAINLGRYATRNEVLLKDISGAQGIFMSFTGLQPQEISNHYRILNNKTEFSKFQRSQEKMIVKYFRIAMRAKTEEERIAYLKKVKMHFLAGDFTPSQVSQIWSKAGKGLVETVEQLESDYAKTDPERLKAYLEKIKRKQN